MEAGQLLAQLERGKVPGKGKMIATGFRSFLSQVGLTRAQTNQIAGRKTQE
jgi:hypothetical protein